MSRGNGSLVLAILLLGFLARAIQFPNNPPGLYVDEAGAGYETLSLIHTGADRWGTPLPVYFISWGSGQSVLYSYLSIPFVMGFGLSRFSIRLLSLFVGTLTLVLLYVSVKRAFGRRAAWISTLLLAVMPWHVMISRWALDANLLPFFLLLGTYTVTRVLQRETSFGWHILSLVPWALGLYAYAMAYVVVPVLILLILVFYRKQIWARNKAWLAAFGVFAFLAMPIALFLIKNFVLQDPLAFNSIPWLGIPLLPVSRLAQVSGPWSERLLANLLFVLNGLQDNEIRNAVPGNAPTFLVLFPLACAGVWYLIRDRRADIFVLWLGACLPLFLISDPAINRVNAVFIPLLVIAVHGLAQLLKHLHPRRVLLVGVGALVAVQAIVFSMDYYIFYPTAPDTALAFFQGFDRALSTGLAAAGPTDAVLVTARIALPDILTAFYASYPPEEYARDRRYSLEYGGIQVKSLGRFYFGVENLPNPHAPFTFVLAKWDEVPCLDRKPVLETRMWQVGKCNAGKESSPQPSTNLP